MISAGTAFAASDDGTVGEANDAIVAETIDDTSNVLNSYATDELIDNGENVLSAGDECENTTIRAFSNVSYARPLVAEDLGVYVFDLTPENSTLPLLVARNITVQFGDELPINCTTVLGVGAYTIPNGTAAGKYSITLTFVGDEKYGGSCFTTEIEIYDVETEITAIGDMSYPRILVKDGYGYYPLLLNANATVPMPLANRTVMVSFNGGKYEEFITGDLGIVNYVIPNDTYAGTYSIDVVYKGDDDGYIGSDFTANVEVYDIDTMILAFDNMTYSRPSVIDGDAVYPIMLTTNMSVDINGSVIPIPIPLANKTVWIAFDNGQPVNFTTNSFGLINYNIPYVDKEGNYTIWMLYDGEDGYVHSELTTTVEVYDVETQILSLGNASYPRPLVVEGYGYYPLMLTTNVSIEINGTKVNIPVPLANKTVIVQFEMYTPVSLTTNAFGLINYTIPYVDMEGNYTISAVFIEDGYVTSNIRTTVEIYDVATKIYSLGNASYPRPAVIEGLGYYPIMLTTDEWVIDVNGTEIPVPIPLANRSVWISFNGTGAYYNTSAYGIVNYVLPYVDMPGNYSIDIAFDSNGPRDEGYEPTSLVTTVEIYDVETQFISLGNLSYPRPVVIEGYGYYPIMLATNTSIPIPLANMTVYIGFDDEDPVNFTTDSFGIVYYVIPVDAEAGVHNITMFYLPDEGYVSSALTTTVELYDVPTQIFALDNVSYPRPVVIEGYGYYPIALTTDLGFDIFNVTIPVDIPLANRTIFVQFDDREIEEFMTDEFGIVYYVIPEDALAGNHTIWMLYDGEDGYKYVEITTTVELYNVPTQIFALDNVSYPRPVVVEGLGYYPIGLTTDIGIDIFNTTIPIDIPLINRTVWVQFDDDESVNFTTDEYGMIYYVIPVDAEAGNHTISMFFDGVDGYVYSELTTTVELYDVPTKIYAIDNLTYPRALVIEDLAYCPLVLTTDTYVTINGTKIDIPIPLANKTVYIGLDEGDPEEFTTNELGVVLYTLPFEAITGDHTIVMVYEGEGGYSSSRLDVDVEVVDIDTQIFAVNMSYPTIVVDAGLGYYPIGLTTDIPVPIDINYTIVITENCTIPIVINTTIPIDIPLANKTIHVFFDGVESEIDTNDYGIATYVIPEDVTAGNYTVEIIFAGTDGYRDSRIVTNVEVFDIPTEITSLGDLSYPAPLVISGLAYYPIVLTTDLSITLNGTVVPIPLPLVNMPVTIEINGQSDEYKTDSSGMVYYVIPEDTPAGNYTIEIAFAGQGGYAASNLTTNVEIYDVATKFIAPENLTFVASEVTSGEAIFSIFLTTNSTIPIPLINATITVDFNGIVEEYTTNWLGMVRYVIPEGATSGNYTVYMTFEGEDGYAASQGFTNVEIIGIDTQIIAAANVTVMVSDLENTQFNLTLLDENGNVLANKTVTVEFNGVSNDYVTDENGVVFYTLSNATAGSYIIDMSFKGIDNYTASNAITELTLVQAPTKIYLRNALYFVLQNKIVNVTLWDANNNPVVGKTVHITIGNLTWSGVTDETGTAHIRVGIGYGVHNATVHFDGDGEYAASNRSGFVRVIKETPSVMVRGDNTRFKVSDTKIVKVYLWDRTSKPLPVNSKIAIKVNGQTYIGFTDSQGIASIKIDLNKPGTFNAEVKYAGNSAYNAVTRNVKFVVQ